jgi:integrase
MSTTEIKRYMRGVVNQINIELAAGKNPFIEAESPKAYCKLQDAIESFLKLKKREIRADTYRAYNSFCSQLLSWLGKKNLKECYSSLFNKAYAIEYMNELALREDIGNTTWNNYLTFNNRLWNWFIENGYCKENPFTGFSKKRESKKRRILIPQEITGKIFEYCREHNPNLEIVIDLVRIAFIRPSEICQIQISEIDLENRVIFIPGEKAKNHNDRFAYLPTWFYDKIRKRNYDRYPKNYYMISQRLEPSDIPIDTRRLDKHWDKLRNKLGLAKEMQLYSYRDTGITYLEEKGVPRNVIQKLTDHHSEKMVGKYVHQPNKQLLNDVVSKLPESF